MSATMFVVLYVGKTGEEVDVSAGGGGRSKRRV